MDRLLTIDDHLSIMTIINNDKQQAGKKYFFEKIEKERIEKR